MVGFSEKSVKEDFSQQIRKHLQRLRAGQVQVHIPERCQLHTRQENAFFHPDSEFFIQTGGATDFVCPGATFRMHAGDMCVMPRGLPHAETPIDLQMPYRVLVIGQAFILEGRSNRRRQILSNPSLLWEKRLRPFEWMHYLDDLAEYACVPEPDRSDFIRSLVDAFLIGVLYELGRESDADEVAELPLVVDARKYVRIHLGESSMSVRQIAGALGCTPDHLSRQFHQATGMKLMAWIAGERIVLAKKLLKETHHNVAEVGWAAGFNEPSYFIRVFKRHLGMTPRNYRLMQRRE